MDEQVQVRVAYGWDEVGDAVIDDQGKLAFPRLARQPGIYMITIIESDGAGSIYIGEADNLQRRFAHYRNPGPSQRTNQRINARLVSVLKSDGAVTISTATNAQITIKGRDAALDLASKPVRLLAENAALVQTTVAGHYRIENL